MRNLWLEWQGCGETPLPTTATTTPTHQHTHYMTQSAQTQTSYVLYTSVYSDGLSEYRELCLASQVPVDTDLNKWATETEDCFGERDEDGRVWDGDRLYEVQTPRFITTEDRNTLARLNII